MVQAYSDAAGSWSLYGSPLTGDDASDGLFGGAVALSTDGSTALVGEIGGGAVGEAWVFTNSGSGFTKQSGGALMPTGEVMSTSSEGNLFGGSVALSANGDTALVGEPGAGNYGEAWAFGRTGSSWSAGQKLTSSAGVFFGASVALSSEGGTALIGAAAGATAGAGSAFLFAASSGGFVLHAGPVTPADEVAGRTGSPTAPASAFGQSVALSADGSAGLIGGPDDNFSSDGFAGAAWVYQASGAIQPPPPPSGPLTTTATVANQRITLTTPPPSTCTPPSERLSIRFATSAIPHSRNRKLKFHSASFLIGKGVAHERRHGQTTHTPNAILYHSPGTVSLSLKGLSKGARRVQLVIGYTTSRGRHRTAAVTKTIYVSFTVC